MKKTKVTPKIRVDYPQPNERIYPSNYAFRIGTRIAGPVEISIDDGPWQSCRPAVGYWWFDWNVAAPGKHRAVARIHTDSSRTTRTRPRSFHIAAPGAKPVKRTAAAGKPRKSAVKRTRRAS